ncbi:MAG: NAD(+) synthase [Veillonellaceae bacterium]|nr:NAD(+) synthase [Veillonellaceae bacterium]
MLKVALGQMEIVPGRPDLNTQTMLSMIEQARKTQADIIVFPEMAIPGYLLGDTWEQSAFLRDCEEYGRQIIAASTDICIVFGNVAMDWQKLNDDGRVRKYNACFVAYNNKLLGGDNFPYPFRIKTLHPNYREFDASRHFHSLRKLASELGQKIEDLLQPVRLRLSGQALRLGCILCEDDWCDNYPAKPLASIQNNGPVDLLINISSSPYIIGKNNKRNRVFSKQAAETGVPLIYVNNVGVQNNGKTIYTYDGFSTVYDALGQVVDYCEPFTSKLKVVKLHADSRISTNPISVPNDNDISSVYQAITYGIKKFINAIGLKKVVIGASGGIDSAVSAALYAKIVGPENLLLINMPSIYNSQTTKDLSQTLARNLGCHYAVMPIQHSVDFTVEQLSNTQIINYTTNLHSNLLVSAFVTENIQARDRSARILAGAAAAFGGGFTCNGNKSEMTVGYSTLYGDLAGFLAALADLWKHQVYDLARYLNEHIYKREVIPQATIAIVPSAELSSAQSVDQGKGDPIIYPYHDFLFRSFIEWWNKPTPEDILRWYSQGILEEKLGCTPGLVNTIFDGPHEFINDLERWWKLFSGMAVAKRIQAPPVLAISRRAYGLDHREAQNGAYFTAEYYKLKDQLLKD